MEPLSTTPLPVVRGVVKQVFRTDLVDKSELIYRYSDSPGVVIDAKDGE